MQITGKLGDVMQESVKAAKSYIRSKSLDYGIIPQYLIKRLSHSCQGRDTKRWTRQQL